MRRRDQTDRTIPAYLSRELYAGIKNAQYIEIPTIRGHLGGAAPAQSASRCRRLCSPAPTR
jgi:hypothetical protein